MLQFQVDDINHALFNVGHIQYKNTYPAPSNFYHPDNAVDIVDMFWYESEIWACSKQIRTHYLKFNPVQPETVTYFDSPQYYPLGIFVDSTKIYLASHYSNESKLYLIDKVTQNILGYYAFLDDVGQLTSDGHYLWIASTDSIKKYSFY